MSAASPARQSKRRRISWPPMVALGFSAVIALLFAMPVPNRAASPVVASRDLRFLAGPDGAIAVRDAASGVAVARIAPEDQGFGRGFIHALDFIRSRHRVALDRPFRLERLLDGRLVLLDPAIPGTAIDVESFGPTNERTIGRFLGEAS